MNKNTYRIRTNVSKDSVLNVKLDQSYDVFEILSLKLNQSDLYKLHTSNYGVIVGRVLANGGFGIPNAKVSVFIGVSDMDINDPIISALYPYNTTNSKNSDGIRYNLLPDSKVNDCHQIIGTFPNKRLVLDDNNVLEVYDTYYKFTTCTNESGDYMIFGVPTGNQTIHVDLDLSDIGILSQRPRDLIYKGYNITQFENPNQFKKDTNIDSLSQVYSQDSIVNVYPFWGDESENVIAISRSDIQIQYKIEPTCVFLGSIVSDNNSNGVTKKCITTNDSGRMDKLVTGNGTIEMIRKKQDGSVEEFQIQGTQLIDGNGVWCYQIPMNLDYMTTDEYGNMVPTDNPEKGIPTRTRVRFRISMQDFESEYTNNFRAKVLVPNNPKNKEDLDYAFGSASLDDEFGTKSFRDLFWNNVYSVKCYIPRIQKGNSDKNERFTGIKNCNIHGNNNPIPYNNIRIRMPFMFVIMCAIVKCLLWIVKAVNWMIARLPGIGSWPKKKRDCIYLGEGLCPEMEGWYFAPNCGGKKDKIREKQMQNTLGIILEKEGYDPYSIDQKNNEGATKDGEPVCLTNQTDYLVQCVEINLAQEYEVIKFDFYNDWINGLIYIPRWFRTIRKKRSYLFGLIKIKPKVQACMESSFNNTRNYTQQCSLDYSRPDGNSNYYTKIVTSIGCKNNDKQKCHKSFGRRKKLVFGSKGGIVHEETTLKDQIVYYFKPCEFENRGEGYLKINLFATDIILLGSLNDCDLYGVPQAFKELQSSSYQIPTNLAMTNMDEEGFMYGQNDDGSNGVVCNNTYKLDEGVKLVDQKFSTYRTWSKDQPFADPELNDDGIAVTEMSGIDWGYTGPGQDKSDLSKLYLPGGHFLGISCTNAETNIKSCVNLSRVCEQGVWMSQRQMIPRSYNDGNFEYLYLTPNGLISKDEISDTNFRSMFATLNFNNLKTVYDEKTGYLKYDFSYLRPINFNGELNEIIEKSLSGDKNFYFKNNVGDDDSGYDFWDKNNSTTELENSIRRALESNSDDYYRFRLGLTDDYINKYNSLDEAIRLRYCIDNQTTVSMPIYENSYYFYFGLKDGSTALDIFKKDFYSACPVSDEYVGDISILTDNGGLCGDDDGKATIVINDLTFPCRFSLYLNESEKDVLDLMGCRKYIDGTYLYNGVMPSDGITINGKNVQRAYVTNTRLNNKKYYETLYYEDDDFTLDFTSDYSNNKYTTTDLGNNWGKAYFTILDENNNESSDIILFENNKDIIYNYRADGGNAYYWTEKIISLHNLPKGKHKFVLIDANAKVIEKEFTINQPDISANLAAIDFNTDVSDKSVIELQNNVVNRDAWDGYLTFNGKVFTDNEIFDIYGNDSNNISILIEDDTIEHNRISNNSNAWDNVNLMWDKYVKKDENKIYVWKQNVTYKIYLKFKCDNVWSDEIAVGSYYITGPSKLKLYFGCNYLDNNDVPSTSEWWNNISNITYSGWNGKDEEKRWLWKKFLFYTEKFSENGYSQIVYGGGGTPPYTYLFEGEPELYDDETQTALLYGSVVKSDEDYGDYNLSLSNVTVPTWNYKINKNDKRPRYNFGVLVSDAVKTYVPGQDLFISFPVMYRPFYFNAVVWYVGDILSDEPVKMYGSIYNGITYNNRLGRCGFGILNDTNDKYTIPIEFGDVSKYGKDEQINGDDFDKNGRIIKLSDYKINDLSLLNNKYTLTIEEGYPSEYKNLMYINNIASSVNVTFYDDLILSYIDESACITCNGSSSNASYFLVNAEKIDGNKFYYPSEDEVRNGTAPLFDEELDSNKIVNDSNGNVILLSFDSNNIAQVLTPFANYYVIGMNTAVVANDNNETNNKLSICRIYNVYDGNNLKFNQLSLTAANNEILLNYTFNSDELSLLKARKKVQFIIENGENQAMVEVSGSSIRSSYNIVFDATTIESGSFDALYQANSLNVIIKVSNFIGLVFNKVSEINNVNVTKG